MKYPNFSIGVSEDGSVKLFVQAAEGSEVLPVLTEGPTWLMYLDRLKSIGADPDEMLCIDEWKR